MSIQLKTTVNKESALRDILVNAPCIIRMLDMVKGPLVIEVVQSNDDLEIRAFSLIRSRDKVDQPHAMTQTDLRYYTIESTRASHIDIQPYVVPSPIHPSGLFGPILSRSHILTSSDKRHLFPEHF